MYIKYKIAFVIGVLLVLGGISLFAYNEWRTTDYIALADKHLASSGHSETLEKPQTKIKKKKSKKKKDKKQKQTAPQQKIDTPNIEKEQTAQPEVKAPTKLKESTIKPKETKKDTPKSEKYYIISGCFSSEENANTHVKNLKQEGFNNAFVVGKVNDLYNVSFGIYNTREEAEKNLNEIKEKFQSSAWILYI